MALAPCIRLHLPTPHHTHTHIHTHTHTHTHTHHPPTHPATPKTQIGEPIVKEFAENHTDTTVAFSLSLTPALAPLVTPCAGAGKAGITSAVKKVRAPLDGG